MFASNNGNLVASLELKKGRLRVSEILPQLRAGARFVDNIVPESRAVNFHPIAVIGGKIHRRERLKLSQKNSRVRFRGKFESILLLKCSQPLTETFSRAT